ncbi:hydrogenase expression/formation protein [Aquabacter sp. L1I39]|uniref:hydrogenase expression/formation protein n=1 Tax=Aquabacter sp. L1I39 TaxID=2820278 RepID=UPI001ADBCD11|nr:hydrogenase expression/formation protein [Aquabacter sp. L1I39]QTL04652.1 hydrogenase expression/formation protein [Aquabacter sp. L1I39]
MASSPFATQPPIGFGPGSQPQEDDGLAYMPLPSGMRVFEPHVPDAVDTRRLAPALNLLTQVWEALQNWRAGAHASFAVSPLDAANRALIDECLGEGEVAVKVSGDAPLEIQEATFAGVWRVRGAGGVDRIEVGPFPRGALVRAFRPSWTVDLPALAVPAPGIFNAPPLITEIVHKAQALSGDGISHVINFSLLPHTPEDLALIETVLGEGNLTILSRGYGNCRIDACALKDVWRVRYYNSNDMLILDTIEITRLPEVAAAAPEDLADSAQRLAEVLETVMGAQEDSHGPV